MNFLVFQHVPHEDPGLITRCANERGVALTVVELWKPYQIPQSGSQDAGSPDAGCHNTGSHDALIIMGGPMAAYEDYPSKEDEVDFIRRAMDTIPILGICLGSQLMAYALGARVYPNEANGKPLKEIGYYDVDLTEEGLADPMFAGVESPMKVQQWHGDTFDLPRGASLLATAPACTNQAFRFGKNAYGFQFHFEFSPQMIQRLLETDNDWIHTGFHPDESLIKQQARDYASSIEASCARLFDNFVRLCARQ